MHILIIHEEARSFAGAERMLNYFAEAAATQFRVTIAAVKESRFGRSLPKNVEPLWVVANSAFSPGAFARQFGAIRRAQRRDRFDLVHGWAARDWPLAALAGALSRVPAVGTLHDHPKAPFHSRGRQCLMRASARWGLDRVICVSEAVRQACLQSGYQEERLAMVHNGLPEEASPSSVGAIDARQDERRPGPFRIGFLGVFTERKGLHDFFSMLDQLALSQSDGWQARLAGGAQDGKGEQLVQQIRREFGQKNWWAQVEWCGWAESPAVFLRSLDLLVAPSSEFDPFPTVLLEAGREGVPVLASAVGGIPEIVRDGETGWLFEPGRVDRAAAVLAALVRNPDSGREAGRRARARVGDKFSVGKMVAGYGELYSTLRTN